MFCPNCGKELPQSAVPLKFCPHCGTSLERYFGPIGAVAEAKEAAEEVKAEIKEAAAETKSEVKEAAVETEAEVKEAVREVQTAVQETAGSYAAAAQEKAEILKESVNETAEATAESIQETAEAKAEEPADILQKETSAPAVQEEGSKPVSQEEASQPASAPEEVTEDIPQAEPVTEVKTAAAEPKKNSKLPIILAALLVIAGIAGYFIYQNLPSTKIGKLMSSAQSYLMQDEYQAAIDELEAARQLQPDNPDITEAQADAYSAYARYFVEGGDDMGGLEVYKQAVSIIEQLPADKKDEKLSSLSEEISGIADYYKREGQYDKALEILQKKLEVFPGMVAGINREELEVYSEWARSILDSGNVKMIELFKKDVLDPVMERPEMAALQPLYDEAASVVENDKLLASLSEMGAALYRNTSKNKRSVTVDTFYMDCLNNFGIYNPIGKWCVKNTDKLPLIADIEGTEDRIGMYVMNGTIYCYIGEYEGNERSGTGVWFTYQGTPLSSYQKYYAYG
ncbi:MAG: zinc-ribbon domain-containing protein, partial [Firmicutes bacterium]|nr:zinc-ribbon domain-containing protein [Bacillota bacterium]